MVYSAAWPHVAEAAVDPIIVGGLSIGALVKLRPANLPGLRGSTPAKDPVSEERTFCTLLETRLRSNNH